VYGNIGLMQKHRVRQVFSALSGALLLVLPFLAAPLLRLLPHQVAGYLSIASVLAGVLMFGVAAHLRLKSKGLGWIEDRPKFAIAGAPWALLFPNVTIHIALLGAAGVTASAFIVYGAGDAKHVALFAVLLCGTSAISFVYFRALLSRRAQRNQILRRSDSTTYAELLRDAARDPRSRDALESIDAIARVLRVPASKVKMGDRFGIELGTMSPYDETLDLLSGILLARRRRYQRSLELEHIRTVGDFVRDWSTCSVRSHEGQSSAHGIERS
jgi:hypothetical protein